MKKILILLLVLSMAVFSFTACFGGNNDQGGDQGGGQSNNGESGGDENTPCTTHKDADENKKCDTCGADIPDDGGVMDNIELPEDAEIGDEGYFDDGGWTTAP